MFEDKARYRGAYGGAAASQIICYDAFNIMMAYTVLCAREIQNSIKDSVLKELKSLVNENGWHGRYELGVNYIKGYNGTEFIFEVYQIRQPIQLNHIHKKIYLD